MPQVISLVRGTLTVYADGTSPYTIFTNSGTGIATRVIVNQLVVSVGNTLSNYIFNIYHTSSGGSTSIIGSTRNSSNVSASAFQFAIGNSTGLPFNGAQMATGTGQATAPSIYASGGSDMFSGATNSTSQMYNSSGVNIQNYIPSNFWIGPNDVIRTKIQAGTQDVTLGYSFTLITETA